MKKILLTLFLVMSTALAYDYPTKNYTFSPRTTAKSSEVNSNFDNLYNGLDGTNSNKISVAEIQILGSSFVSSSRDIDAANITVDVITANKLAISPSGDSSAIKMDSTGVTISLANGGSVVLNVDAAEDSKIFKINSAKNGTDPVAFISFAGYQGSTDAPSATLTDNIIGGFNGNGYGATAFGASGKSAVFSKAAQLWTDSAQGTYLYFETCPTDSTSQRTVATVNADGKFEMQTFSINYNTPNIIEGTLTYTVTANGVEHYMHNDVSENQLQSGNARYLPTTGYENLSTDNLQVTVPGPGTYMFYSNLRVIHDGDAAGYLIVRLFNTTDGGAVPNSERMAFESQAGTLNVINVGTSFTWVETLDSGDNIHIQGLTNAADTIGIFSDTNGFNTFGYVRLH